MQYVPTGEFAYSSEHHYIEYCHMEDTGQDGTSDASSVLGTCIESSLNKTQPPNFLKFINWDTSALLITTHEALSISRNFFKNGCNYSQSRGLHKQRV